MSTENNLEDMELKILLTVEKSGEDGCYFPSLVQATGLSETKVKYYLDRLTDDLELLDWSGRISLTALKVTCSNFCEIFLEFLREMSILSLNILWSPFRLKLALTSISVAGDLFS